MIGRTVWFKLGAPEDETDETILVKKKLNRKRISSQKMPRNQNVTQGILPIFD
jgi:hypothetical protein